MVHAKVCRLKVQLFRIVSLVSVLSIIDIYCLVCLHFLWELNHLFVFTWIHIHWLLGNSKHLKL